VTTQAGLLESLSRFVRLILVMGSFGAPGVVWGQSGSPYPMKSEGAAFVYSFVGTVAPVGIGWLIKGNPESATDIRALVGGSIMACGLIFGPGLGHVYAGNEGAVGLGATLRMSGVAFCTFGALLYENMQTSGTGSWTDDALVVTGVALVFGGTLFDWFRAPGLVHQENQAAGRIRAQRIELRPSLSGLTLRLNVG